MEILGFGITQMATFVLVLVRVLGIFTSAPVFSNKSLPPQVRIAMAFVLSLVFVPMANADAISLEILPFFLAIVKETLVGVLMGFLAAMVFAAIQMAGAFIDLHVGFSFAAVVDPMTQEQNAVLGQLHYLAASLLFLAVNGHHIVIRGLAESFMIIPLGQMTLDPQAAGGMMHIFVTIFLAALKIGAPVFGAIFLTDVALGILARTVPQLNVFIVGFPVKLAVGLAAVFVVMPMAFTVMTSLFAGLHRDLIMLLRHLSG